MTVDEKLAVIAKAIIELAEKAAVPAPSTDSDWPDNISTGVQLSALTELMAIAEGGR